MVTAAGSVEWSQLAVRSNKLVVFAESPNHEASVKTVESLEAMVPAGMRVENVGYNPEHQAVRDWLAKDMGSKYANLPAVYIDGKPFGGAADVAKACNSGAMRPRLEALRLVAKTKQ